VQVAAHVATISDAMMPATITDAVPAVTPSIPDALPVSQNGQSLSRRGRSLPAAARGFDTHRDPITSRFGQVHPVLGAAPKRPMMT
jgi:hypothetical protein